MCADKRMSEMFNIGYCIYTHFKVVIQGYYTQDLSSRLVDSLLKQIRKQTATYFVINE